jgi:acetyl esterase/lipase
MIDDPEILAFIARSEALYPPDSNIATPEENRRNYDALCAVFRQPRPEGVEVQDQRIGAVAVRHYKPRGATDRRPAVIYLHGGGFVVGSLESHDDICAEIADNTGLTVTAADYRLAPEHDYPAQIDDVETVWRHRVDENPSLIVVGDSAGGSLCAALSLRMRRLGGPMPVAQVLIYPGLGGDHSWASYVENAEAPLLRTSDVSAYRRLYSNSARPSEQEIEEAAPLQATTFTNLPPTWTFTADVDPVRDDGKVYIERLKEAGVVAEWQNHAQLVHGYLRGRMMSRRIHSAFREICQKIRFAASNSETFVRRVMG